MGNGNVVIKILGNGLKLWMCAGVLTENCEIIF